MIDSQHIVDTYYQQLYRFGISLTRDVDRAADLVQQVFVIWAQKGHQLKDDNKVKSWLFTSLYREHLRLAKRQNRFPSQDYEEAAENIPAESTSADRTMDAQLALDLLGQLDETYRAPLTLFYLQQHSYKEIAEILDIPIGTVMSRISRAKEQLRNKMLREPSSAPQKIVTFNPEILEQNG